MKILLALTTDSYNSNVRDSIEFSTCMDLRYTGIKINDRYMEVNKE